MVCILCRWCRRWLFPGAREPLIRWRFRSLRALLVGRVSLSDSTSWRGRVLLYRRPAAHPWTWLAHRTLSIGRQRAGNTAHCNPTWRSTTAWYTQPWTHQSVASCDQGGWLYGCVGTAEMRLSQYRRKESGWTDGCPFGVSLRERTIGGEIDFERCERELSW